MPVKRISDEKGFTLIEVLVALLVLMIIIFSFSILFVNSYTNIFSAGTKSEAIYLAQEKMEATIADLETILTLDSLPEGITIENYTNIVGTSTLSGKKITIALPYTDSRGLARTITLTSIVLQ